VTCSGEPLALVVSVICGGAALSLRPYGPDSRGRGKMARSGQAHTSPVRTPPGRCRRTREEAELLEDVGQVPVDRVLAQNRPSSRGSAPPGPHRGLPNRPARTSYVRRRRPNQLPRRRLASGRLAVSTISPHLLQDSALPRPDDDRDSRAKPAGALEDSMSANTGSPYARPKNAPPYYLGRPASLWITAHRRRPQAGAGRTTPGRSAGRTS
jgi:hypothetical protein